MGSPRCPPASVSPPAGRDCPSPSQWHSKRGRFRELELGSPSREDAPHRGRAEGPTLRAAIRRQGSGCPHGPTLRGSGAASLGLVTAWPGRATAGERAAPSPCTEGGAAAEPACRAHGEGRRPPGHRSPRQPLFPHRLPSLGRGSATPAGQETYPVEASWLAKATVAEAHAGRSRWKRLRTILPGWSSGSLASSVAAPAQGSPSSARPCDLRAAERLQPPKLDRGWGLGGERQKAPTDGQRGKSRVAPKSGEQEDCLFCEGNTSQGFIPSGGHTEGMYFSETSCLSRKRLRRNLVLCF